VRARFRSKSIKPAVAMPSDSPVAARTFPAAPSGAEVVEYKSGDASLKAWLAAAPGADAGKRPGVIVLHNLRGLAADEWAAVHPFRDANFILLMPSLRAEYGQPGANSGYYNEVDDVLAAAAYLKSRPDVDADHVFLVGFGYGAPLALLAAEASPAFRAVTSNFGLHDLLLLSKLMPPEDRARFTFDIADPHEFEVRSPLAYATSLKCPARLYYPHGDPFIAPTNIRLAEVARQHHLNVTATEISGDAKTAIIESFRQALAFFQEQP
jgi:dipeptidyl aminopeptidase/acylaminoacyl peptidase